MKLLNFFKFGKSKKEDTANEPMSFKDYVKNNVLSLDQIFERNSYLGSTNPISRPAKSSYLVYKCIQTLSDRIPRVPLKFYSKSTGEEFDASTNEVSEFITNPGDITFTELLSRSIMYYALYGESFWVIVDSIGNDLGISKIPSRIDIIDPLALNEDLDGSYQLKGWMYSANYKNNEIKNYLPKESVIQIKNANPYNMWRGLRAVDAIANELGVDVKSVQELMRFYDNFAIPGTILTAPLDSPITPEDMKHYVDQFNNKAMGMDKRFNTVGFSGGVTATTLGVTQDKQQLIETKTFLRDVVLSVFNVPLTYAGFTEGINRATAETQERNFWQYAASILYKIEDTINLRLIRKLDPNIECRFDYDSIDALKKDIVETSQAALNFMKLGYSANDLNEKFKWDLPVTDVGKNNYKEFNLEIIGSDGTVVESDIPLENTFEKKDIVNDSLSNRTMRKKFDSLQINHERKFKKKLQAYFFNQRKKVLDVLSKHENAIEKIVLYKLMSQLGKVFEEENNRIEKTTKPYYEAMVLASQQYAYNIIGIERDVILNTKVIQERVNLIRGVNDTVFKRIKKQIFEGINKGETIDDIANRIRTVYNYSTSSGATLIARTETVSVINAATHEEYKVNGVEKKRWLTAHDSKVRPDCRKAEAQGAIPMDSTFHHGLEYPSAYRCRCCLVPEIK